MKPDTLSFYARAILQAVTWIAEHLDDALDLATLARGAALSPFHFHRVFRGMTGETPLDMHRRLRMERAAWRLLHDDVGVTGVAFEAGYETHESFTRAFRALYGRSPSAFRQGSPGPGADCARPSQIELAARCGVHFRAGDVAHPGVAESLSLSPPTGGIAMDVEIKEMPALRLGAVRHIGPYHRISEAFEKLGAIAGPAGLLQQPGIAMVGVYHDDPDSTPAEALRSDAALSFPEPVALPAGLEELRLPAGRYASTTHVGPYTALGDVWARLMGEWLPSSGHRVADGLSYEIYRNTPGQVPEHQLRTELYVPLA